MRNVVLTIVSIVFIIAGCIAAGVIGYWVGLEGAVSPCPTCPPQVPCPTMLPTPTPTQPAVGCDLNRVTRLGKSVGRCFDEQFKEYECMVVFFEIDNMSMPPLEIPLAEATEERINAEICAQMARLPE